MEVKSDIDALIALLDERHDAGGFGECFLTNMEADQLIAALREMRDERDALRKALRAYIRGADSGHVSVAVDNAARAALKGPTP